MTLSHLSRWTYEAWVHQLQGGARDASRFTEMEIARALHQEELTDLTMQLQEREEVAEQKRAQLDQQLKDALQDIQKLQSQLQVTRRSACLYPHSHND